MRKLLFLLGLGLSFSSFAQEKDTIIMLAPARIVADLPQRIQGVRELRMSSGIANDGISSDISLKLRENIPVLIRSYGPGSSGSLIFRGSGPAHTRITWNGIPIRSATLGQTDISLLSSVAADDIHVFHGGAGSTGDASAIGAHIDLITKPTTHTGFWYSMESSVNNTGGWEANVLSTLNRTKWSTSLRLSHLRDLNHFRFHDNTLSGPDYPEKIRENAGLQTSHAIADIYYYPASNNTLHGGVWAQLAERDLASSLLVPDIPDNEWQGDRSVRGFIRWDRYQGKWHLKLNLAGSHEQMHYTNRIASIDAIYLINGIFHDASWSRTIQEHHTLKIGESAEIQTAESAYYAKTEKRYTQRFFMLAYGPLGNNIRYFGLMRAEMMNGRIFPLSPSLGLLWHVRGKDDLILKGNINRNIRIPTMNDLYWVPGGNPDLEAEEGWQAELGIQSGFETGSIQVKNEITFYAGKVDNWIQWLPHPEMNYWTPVNLKSVSQHGVEISSSYFLQRAYHKHHLQIQYAYTSTYNSAGQVENEESLGKQLIYVPLHSGRFHYEYYHHSVMFRTGCDFIGKRFTTASNTRYMPAYMVWDASVAYKLMLEKYQLQFGISAYNLLNTDYQVIAWYPMPLRFYKFSIRFQRKEI